MKVWARLFLITFLMIDEAPALAMSPFAICTSSAGVKTYRALKVTDAVPRLAFSSVAPL
jgi:hypothetical protein